VRDSWLPGTDPVRLRVDRGRDGTTSDGHDTAGRLSGLDYPSGAGFEQDWSDRDEPTAMRAHGPGTTPTVYESQYLRRGGERRDGDRPVRPGDDVEP
jgi:hypothetical protein